MSENWRDIEKRCSKTAKAVTKYSGTFSSIPSSNGEGRTMLRYMEGRKRFPLLATTLFVAVGTVASAGFFLLVDDAGSKIKNKIEHLSGGRMFGIHSTSKATFNTPSGQQMNGLVDYSASTDVHVNDLTSNGGVKAMIVDIKAQRTANGDKFASQIPNNGDYSTRDPAVELFGQLNTLIEKGQTDAFDVCKAEVQLLENTVRDNAERFGHKYFAKEAIRDENFVHSRFDFQPYALNPYTPGSMVILFSSHGKDLRCEPLPK
jgi:hypothetical protein